MNNIERFHSKDPVSSTTAKRVHLKAYVCIINSTADNTSTISVVDPTIIGGI